jgi:hypothetical protein
MSRWRHTCRNPDFTFFGFRHFFRRLLFWFVDVLSEAVNDGGSSNENKGTINLTYVEWDTEVASTHVVGEVLKESLYWANCDLWVFGSQAATIASDSPFATDSHIIALYCLLLLALADHLMKTKARSI